MSWPALLLRDMIWICFHIWEHVGLYYFTFSMLSSQLDELQAYF